jgi:hypothetical protein
VAPSRRVVIDGLLVAVTVVNAAILSGTLATIFFAITVMYALEPLFEWLRRRVPFVGSASETPGRWTSPVPWMPAPGMYIATIVSVAGFANPEMASRRAMPTSMPNTGWIDASRHDHADRGRVVRDHLRDEQDERGPDDPEHDERRRRESCGSRGGP